MFALGISTVNLSQESDTGSVQCDKRCHQEDAESKIPATMQL